MVILRATLILEGLKQDIVFNLHFSITLRQLDFILSSLICHYKLRTFINVTWTTCDKHSGTTLGSLPIKKGTHSTLIILTHAHVFLSSPHSLYI
jgi:hypothetical protein